MHLTKYSKSPAIMKFSSYKPTTLITFLEKKLEKEPNDLQGWLILSRTCVLSGHYQKADKYYQIALELFPNNENGIQVFYIHFL